MRPAFPILLAFVALVPAVGHAEWMQMTEPVPVDRLVRNLDKRVADDPDDVRVHAVLARVHSLAWASGMSTVELEPAKKEGGLPTFAPYDTIKVVRTVRGPKPDTAAVKHFHRSIHHYCRAVALAPGEALYRLGLAWMLDSGSGWVLELRTPDGAETKSAVPPDERAKYRELLRRAGKGSGRDAAHAALVKALPRPIVSLLAALDDQEESPETKLAAVRVVRHHWQNLALVHYRRAHALSLEADRKQKSIGSRPEDAISIEAGQAIVRILKERPETKAIRQEIAAIEKSLEGLADVPRWVTPIVFPAQGQEPLRALLSNGNEAAFDMDGDGVPGRWPWPGGDAAFLVWRPDPATPVTSGRQLFGSVTWGMFWNDGYEPLAALDDDGDGVLSGPELTGVAVWRDRNGNAHEDPGEVEDARAFGVRSIRTTSRGLHAGVPAHPRGIELVDDTTRPTYDWTPERLPDAATRP